MIYPEHSDPYMSQPMIYEQNLDPCKSQPLIYQEHLDPCKSQLMIYSGFWYTRMSLPKATVQGIIFHSYANRRMSEPVINKGFGATRMSLPIIYDKFGYYACYTNDLQEHLGHPQATMHAMVCKAIWATRMPQGMVYKKMWPRVCPI